MCSAGQFETFSEELTTPCSERHNTGQAEYDRLEALVSPDKP